MNTLIAPKFKFLFQIAVPCLFFAGLFNADITYEALQSTVSQWPEACLFHRFTSLLCPGCGMTRSLICFFSYNLPLSFYYHPLGPILGLSALALWGVSFWKGWWEIFMSGAMRFSKRHALAAFIFLLVWGAYRNIPGYF